MLNCKKRHKFRIKAIFDCFNNWFSDINECSVDPCEHKRACIDHVNDYECICLPGYIDKNCSTGNMMAILLPFSDKFIKHVVCILYIKHISTIYLLRQ